MGTETKTEEGRRLCLECGDVVPYGRTDKVYCSVKCKNISNSPIWEYNGESLHVVEWAEKIGINAHCLLHRKYMGWTIEEILTTPLRGKRNVKC